MIENMNQIMALMPELTLCVGILAVLLISLGESTFSKAYRAALATSILALLVTTMTLSENSIYFFSTYQVNLFSQLFKLFILFGLCTTILFGRELKDIRENAKPEYLFFFLTATLGLLALVSSIELITLVVALELTSFSLYLLVPLRDEKHGLRIQMESAIKYVLFGLISTGIMLWGISYLFGITGTTDLPEMAVRLKPMLHNPFAVIGIAFALAGVFFKLAVFPFHFWIPDVYEGASNETAAMISTIPKLGVMAVFIRFALLISPEEKNLVDLLMILSICSMFYGNLAALVQKDMKRMLGYSSIAHAGYLLIGMITLGEKGFALSIYYMAGFLVMYLACFLVVCKVSPQGENLSIEDFSGLHKRSPLLALTLGTGMFALAGIPPFVGFMGKFLLFTSAWEGGFRTIVVLAALNTAISIYYYLSVVRMAYTGHPGERAPVTPDPATKILSILLIVLMVLLGIAPGSLIDMAYLSVLGLR
jgi:NADH-quinone oxidoreductase subunit N